MACGEWMPTWGVGNHLALELGNHVALKLGNDLTPELGNHLTLKMGNQVAPELGNQLALRSSKVGNIRGPRHWLASFPHDVPEVTWHRHVFKSRIQ